MTQADGYGSSFPAGWYPDAQFGGQRYWDGNQWTQHWAPAPGAAAQVMPPYPAAVYPTPRKPWFQQTGWIIGGATALVLLFFFIVIAAAGSDETDDKVEQAADTTDAADKQRKSQEPKQTKLVEPKQPKLEKPQSEGPTKKPEPPAPPVVEVTAARMVADYDNNELAADQKYKGKTVRVTGRVDKIDTELFEDDTYILDIGERYSFLTVSCYGMSTDELATLKVGQQVTALGEFKDGGDLGVTLRDCRLP